MWFQILQIKEELLRSSCYGHFSICSPLDARRRKKIQIKTIPFFRAQNLVEYKICDTFYARRKHTEMLNAE